MNADVHTHTKSRKSRTGGLKTLIESSLGVRVHFVLLHICPGGFHFFDLPLVNGDCPLPNGYTWTSELAINFVSGAAHVILVTIRCVSIP